MAYLRKTRKCLKKVSKKQKCLESFLKKSKPEVMGDEATEISGDQ